MFFSLKRFPNYVCLRLYKTSSIPRWVHVPNSEALNSDLIQIHNILKKEPKLLERKTGNHTIFSLLLPTLFFPIAQMLKMSVSIAANIRYSLT